MSKQTQATGYYDQHGREISKAAFFAIKAARIRRQVGRHAATAHALKNGSTPRLVRLAYQLQAALDADLRQLRNTRAAGLLDFRDRD